MIREMLLTEYEFKLVLDCIRYGRDSLPFDPSQVQLLDRLIENMNTDSQLQSLVKQCSMLRDKISELEAQVASLNRDIYSIEKEAAEALRDKDILLKECDELKNEKISLTNQIKELRSSLPL